MRSAFELFSNASLPSDRALGAGDEQSKGLNARPDASYPESLRHGTLILIGADALRDSGSSGARSLMPRARDKAPVPKFRRLP